MSTDIHVDVQDEIPATPHFDFVYGKFALSSWTLPYFCTTMTAQDAASSLRLVQDFPGWEENNWSLEELFQREIDWKRVTQRIVPYLRSTDHPQFFNSITVALLPQVNTEIVPFDHSQIEAPPIDPRYGATRKVLSAGPVTFGYWKEWERFSERAARFGTLRWNPEQAFAVTIDGQHRLAALREVSALDRAADTLVPVILLVFDPKVGYDAPRRSSTTVPLLRSLFIDLNKHAVKVSRSRLILLDDRDPTAVCVRALVGEGLEENMVDLDSSPPRLPLTVVDWHSDSARFDGGPYVTTIIGLDWMIQKALGIRPVSDYTDYSGLRRQLRAIKRTLGVPLLNARKRLADAEDRQRPFNYDDGSIDGEDELQQIADAFRHRWNPGLAHLFTMFEPYARLLRLRKELNTINPLFVQWYQLYSSVDEGERGVKDAYDELAMRLNESDVSTEEFRRRLDRLEGEKGGNLAFNVVFQRALFLAFSEYQHQLSDDDVTDVAADSAGNEEGKVPLDYDEEEADEFFDDLEEAGADDGEGGSSHSVEGNDEDARDEVGEVLRRSQEVVAALNDLVRRWPGFLDARATCDRMEDAKDHQFWLGTLWKAEQSIDFTQGASARAKSLLTWGMALWLLKQRGDLPSTVEFDQFWRDLVHEQTLDDPVYRFARVAVREFYRSRGASKSSASRIVGESAEPELLEAAAQRRFGQLFRVFSS